MRRIFAFMFILLFLTLPIFMQIVDHIDVINNPASAHQIDKNAMFWYIAGLISTTGVLIAIILSFVIERRQRKIDEATDMYGEQFYALLTDAGKKDIFLGNIIIRFLAYREEKQEFEPFFYKFKEDQFFRIENFLYRKDTSRPIFKIKYLDNDANFYVMEDESEIPVEILEKLKEKQKNIENARKPGRKWGRSTLERILDILGKMA